MVDKYSIKRRLLLLILAVLGVVAMLISLVWLLIAIVFSPAGARAWKIVVAYDTLLNASTGGDIGETVSARAYKASLSGNKYGCWLCKLLDYLQKDHCKNSVRRDI